MYIIKLIKIVKANYIIFSIIYFVHCMLYYKQVLNVNLEIAYNVLSVLLNKPRFT